MAREEYDLDPETYKAAALSALEDLDDSGDELAGDDPDPAGTPEP